MPWVKTIHQTMGRMVAALPILAASDFERLRSGGCFRTSVTYAFAKNTGSGGHQHGYPA
jgi:hypothetical protein